MEGSGRAGGVKSSFWVTRSAAGSRSGPLSVCGERRRAEVVRRQVETRRREEAREVDPGDVELQIDDRPLEASVHREAQRGLGPAGRDADALGPQRARGRPRHGLGLQLRVGRCPERGARAAGHDLVERHERQAARPCVQRDTDVARGAPLDLRSAVDRAEARHRAAVEEDAQPLRQPGGGRSRLHAQRAGVPCDRDLERLAPAQERDAPVPPTRLDDPVGRREVEPDPPGQVGEDPRGRDVRRAPDEAER